jgi:hypothetical protein
MQGRGYIIGHLAMPSSFGPVTYESMEAETR